MIESLPALIYHDLKISDSIVYMIKVMHNLYHQLHL